MKKIIQSGALIALVSVLSPSFAQENAPVPDAHPRVLMQTSEGTIVLELDRDKAPKTVENFLSYVRDGFYNGTVFHRVIKGFMIQGGGFTQAYQRKPTKAPVENEANNGLKNEPGTIAMARTPDPHSATSQFFINTVNNTFLNHTAPTPRGWGYAVFGRIVEGMDVVNRIADIPTGSGGPFPKDVPTKPVIIEKVTLATAPAEKKEP